jgi:hypothetical protein
MRYVTSYDKSRYKHELRLELQATTNSAWRYYKLQQIVLGDTSYDKLSLVMMQATYLHTCYNLVQYYLCQYTNYLPRESRVSNHGPLLVLL